MVLGSIISLQSQNKKLTLRAINAIDKITEQRYVMQSAWLNTENLIDSDDGIELKDYSYSDTEILKIPETEQTKSIHIKNFKFNLKKLNIKTKDNTTLFSIIRLEEKD